MLKTSKLSQKPHKSSKDSVLRKSHLSKKTMRSRSPVRLSGSSRPPPMKHISPGMKRGHPIPKRKASHSPRLRSIASSPHRSLSHRSKPESPVSIDRARAMKSLKYEKRKHMSNSPVRHLGPSAPRRPVLPHEPRDISPYLPERYPGTSTITHSSQYSSPTRKKTRRETECYFTSRSASTSPPRRHAEGPLHSDGHMSRRAENASPMLHQKHHRNIPLGLGDREKRNYDMRDKHRESPPPIMPSSRSKDASLKVPYPGESSRYQSAIPGNRYPPGESKTYVPTLHERFSSVIESSRIEPRVRYSREDLEKITIDIRRNLREPSPTLRHIMNPSDVKLVRRANEGHRPIFDREEIKQASRDLREDAYYERKTGTYNSSHAIDLREVENYQITRHRFDSHHETFPSTSGRSLSDRWQNHEGRKDTLSLDRDEREKNYGRVPVSRSYVDARSRSRSGDRDFRSERYLDAKPSSSRADFPSRPPVSSSESRSSAPYPHRKVGLPLDARHKLNFRKSDRESHSSSVRSEVKGHYLPSDRHYSEAIPSSRVERRDHHSPVPDPHKWDYKSRSSSREKLSEFSRRPEKYGYKSWIDKPDISPKSPNYFEHESREGSSSFRGSRPFRSSRGFRSRGFRGPLRGSTYRGSSFRGGYRNSSSPRGRGIARR